MQGDVGDETDNRELLELAEDALGVDVVVNAAGIMPLARWRRRMCAISTGCTGPTSGGASVVSNTRRDGSVRVGLSIHLSTSIASPSYAATHGAVVARLRILEVELSLSWPDPVVG